MSRFLIIEEPRDDRSVFYNFAVLNAESEDEAESKYFDKMDVNTEENILNIFDLESIETDYYHYLQIET